MPLVPNIGRKSPGIRFFIWFVYLSLIFLGTTMVVPFLITLSSSATNDMDYYRFAVVPRYFYSTKDRFMKGLVYYFNAYRDSNRQMRVYIPDMPNYWSGWNTIGKDIPNIDKLAEKYYLVDDAKLEKYKIQAADYSDFCDAYPLSDSEVTIIDPQGVEFIREYYLNKYKSMYPEKAVGLSSKELLKKALWVLNREWGVAFDSFISVQFQAEKKAPLGFQTYFPPLDNPKYITFNKLKDAYRGQFFTPGVESAWKKYLKRQKYSYENFNDVFPVYRNAPAELKCLWGKFKAVDAPASPVTPFALRAVWYQYLQSDDIAKSLRIPAGKKLTIKDYNKLAGTDYSSLEETPFPIPESFPIPMKTLWYKYVKERFPLRLTKLKITPELEIKYQRMLEKDVKYVHIANRLLGVNNKKWSDFKLPPVPPMGLGEIDNNLRNVWIKFAAKLPPEQREYSCSEMAFQKFLLKKYKNADGVNAAYGWNIKHIEEAFPPFIAAYVITMKNHETAFTLQPVLYNYKIILEYLLSNGRAIPVTILLIALTIICTLTVNPLAAYSLSRFNLRGQDKIILFMLATMAFPAMVSAIPAYLLMRDLNMLNTFFALVLPSAANGMSIFILKGFFDSLPQELFEAATIDGATEMQIFRIVAMPMVKPILAIRCLYAFIAAYNGWQWALIICQDKDMWTIAVWLYQASQWWLKMPWIVSAGFIVASIPTLVFFISCQKMILRGIVIPSMK